MQVLAALQDPGGDLEEVERLIGHDVALSLRLLRYINSAFVGLRHEDDKLLSTAAWIAAKLVASAPNGAR